MASIGKILDRLLAGEIDKQHAVTKLQLNRNREITQEKIKLVEKLLESRKELIRLDKPARPKTSVVIEIILAVPTHILETTIKELKEK